MGGFRVPRLSSLDGATGVAGRFGMVGRSPAMLDLYRSIEMFAEADSVVLIEGETGVGKELVARALHRQGRSPGGPFVAFNAANLAETLFESELFGYVKGAFSGAHEHHDGLAVAAAGGTLFLDEIGELPASNQAKLLRFLDTSEVRPVGGVRPRRVDARILCATNRDLSAAVAEHGYRADLYYRLRVTWLRVPSLRERPEDVPLLIRHFTGELARRHGRCVSEVTPEAMRCLLAYGWPGNVRELEHELGRAVVLTPDGRAIAPEVLSPAVQRAAALAAGGGPGDEEGAVSLSASRRRTERRLILATLHRLGWNVTATARELEISRVGLSRKLKHLGIHRPGRRDARSP